MAKRYLVWILGTFLLSLLLCTLFSVNILLIAVGVALLASIIILFTRFSMKQTFFSCAVSAAIAVLLFFGSINRVENLERILIGKECEVHGQVTEIGNNSAGNLTRYQIKLDEIQGEDLRFYDSFSVYLYADEKIGKIGDYISGTLQFFDTPLEYGYGREDRIFLSAYQEVEHLTFESPKGFSWVTTLQGFRDQIQSRISYGSDETIGLLQSICFGNKSSLDFGLGVSLGRIGLSHVMAVSGLHLSFAVLLVNYLLILLGINYRVRYLINIIVSVFFTVIVGFPPSCIRACIMMVLFCAAMALRLFPDGITSLAVAGFLICLFNPFAIRDVGFLLSFLATAGIILIKLPIEHFLFPLRLKAPPIINRVYRYFTGILSCSLAASILTLPVVALSFGSFSIIGPISNVILILPLQICFILGIFMVLLGWIPLIGELIGWLCDLIYAPINGISDWLGHLQYAEISSLQGFGILILILFIILLGISVYHYIRFQRRSFMAFMMILLVFVGGISTLNRAQGEKIKIAFIDVGQGDCTVLSKGGKAVIFDYGGSSEKRYNLIKYLNENQVQSIELLAFTHLHSDHTNGLRTLLKNVYVERILSPYENVDDPQLDVLIQSENGSLIENDSPIQIWEDLTIEPYLESLYSSEDKPENERCICYRVSYGAVSVLITGDLSGRSEIKLLDRDLDSTILKVSHHGSETSTLYPFLKAVSPEVAVISVGENNHGFPHPATCSRLNEICPYVYSTKEDGTVVFESDGTIFERIS